MFIITLGTIPDHWDILHPMTLYLPVNLDPHDELYPFGRPLLFGRIHPPKVNIRNGLNFPPVYVRPIDSSSHYPLLWRKEIHPTAYSIIGSTFRTDSSLATKWSLPWNFLTDYVVVCRELGIPHEGSHLKGVSTPWGPYSPGWSYAIFPCHTDWIVICKSLEE